MIVAPLAKTGFISLETNLMLAAIIGFGFGFFLERAGFGSAKKLTNQWYAKDWSVFRVMFTAIVVAMFGFIILDSLGIMPFEGYNALPTFVHSQILGGLIMGAGFAIGGYCPGTSFVALATGKLDSIFFILGMCVGVLFFAEAYPLQKGFLGLGYMGSIRLPEFFGVNAWVIGIIVLLIAVGGFIGANIVEKKMNA